MTIPRLWVLVAVCLPVVVALMMPMRAGDSAYQVRAGNIMLDTHHVLRTDPFTFTEGGEPWLNQQWGDGVLYALVYRAGAWEALAVLRAVLVGLIFSFIYLACRAAGAPIRRAAGLTLLSFAMSIAGIGGFLSLRPQLFGMFLFALALWITFGRHRHPGRMWAIPAIVAAWANLHGSFFLGPLLLGLAWIEDRRERSPLARRTLRITVISLGATFVSPFGVGVWRYAVDLSFNSTLQRVIVEWQPASIRGTAGAVFFLSALALVTLLARRGCPVPGPALLFLGAFFLLALPATRGIYWWALAAPPAVAAIIRDEPLLGRTGRPARPGGDELGIPFVNGAIAGLLVALGVALLPWWRSVITPVDLLAAAPAGISAELNRALEPGQRIWSAQHYASWFELELPRNPVFVDTRFELFPAWVWRQYTEIALAQEGWQSLLDRWRVSAVVATRGSEPDLVSHLRVDPEWRLVYEDDDGLVFLRVSLPPST